jgi:hypothetical protein
MPKKENKSKAGKNIAAPTSVGQARFRLANILIKKEKNFLIFIAGAFFIAGVVYPYPAIAMWVGFAFAGYSAIANDSIQTIGTFIASNEDKKWWFLWLYIGLIFVVTVFISWYIYDGDVSSQRLMSKGFSEAPSSFAFLQIAAPIVLLVLTRLRMPVSTTFLLLSSFTTSSGAVFSVIGKSMTGYVIAFLSALLIWLIFNNLISKVLKGKPSPAWTAVQWVISGSLWAVWIMQDAANIAIYLPRKLSLLEFIIFASYIFFGLGVLFYLKGDKIQKVIKEKTEVADVRAATLIDFIYAIILFGFQSLSTIPMSTTWVFIGLLGGRELAITISRRRKKGTSLPVTMKLIGRDLLLASIGLIVSIVLAIAVNPEIQKEFKELLVFNQ